MICSTSLFAESRAESVNSGRYFEEDSLSESVKSDHGLKDLGTGSASSGLVSFRSSVKGVGPSSETGRALDTVPDFCHKRAIKKGRWSIPVWQQALMQL